MTATEVIQRLEEFIKKSVVGNHTSIDKEEIEALMEYITRLRTELAGKDGELEGKDATIESLHQSVERLQQFQRNTRAVYENTIQCIIEALVDRR